MAPSTSGLSLSPLKAAFTGSNPVGVTNRLLDHSIRSDFFVFGLHLKHESLNGQWTVRTQGHSNA